MKQNNTVATGNKFLLNKNEKIIIIIKNYTTKDKMFVAFFAAKYLSFIDNSLSLNFTK